MSIQDQLLNQAVSKANEVMLLCDMVSKDGFESISNVGILSPELSFGAVPNHEGFKTLMGQFYGTIKAIMLEAGNFDLKPSADEINSYADYVKDLALDQLNAIPEGDE